MTYTLLFVFLALYVMNKAHVSPIYWIVWIEINFFGKTLIPEIITSGMIIYYLILRMGLWKSMFEIKVVGNRMDFL